VVKHREHPRREFRKIHKGQVGLFIALILLYPVKIWPFRASIPERFFRNEIPPEMSQQERFQAEEWNNLIILVLGAPKADSSGHLPT